MRLRPVPFRLLLALFVLPFATVGADPVAPQPLYRDPVHDGAADPVVVWNPHVGRWWMFYTNRRANVPGLPGVTWVHGTVIGIAESADGGTTWSYAGTADIELPPEVAGPTPTLWAPEIVTAAEVGRHPIGDTSSGGRTEEAGTVHHLFLTVVPGVFADWQHPRRIVHLTSADLRRWRYRATLPLGSDRVIDADVHRLPDGTWRLWYNDERDGKAIHHADSPDLFDWTDRGRATGVNGRPGEGPVVFGWRGRHWMLVDHWRGLGVYHSDDHQTWTAQPGGDLLATPGRGTDDGVNGGHADVVVSGDRAYLFYFTHPGRAGTIRPADPESLALRRSSIQVVELRERDGVLSCDRDGPTRVRLEPPAASSATGSPKSP